MWRAGKAGWWQLPTRLHAYHSCLKTFNCWLFAGVVQEKKESKEKKKMCTSHSVAEMETAERNPRNSSRKGLISCESHFLWTSHLMFWHRYPCKCSAWRFWILSSLLHMNCLSGWRSFNSEEMVINTCIYFRLCSALMPTGVCECVCGGGEEGGGGDEGWRQREGETKETYERKTRQSRNRTGSPLITIYDQ